MTVTDFLKSDPQRHDGVRPVQVLLLRVLYALMLVGVAPDAWAAILGHRGAWEPVRAVAFCVWAAYPTLSVVGLFHPLRMLPIVIFMIFYKSLWLLVVAWPLYRDGMLAGSATEPMAHVFVAAPFLALVVPWGHVVRTYLVPARHARA